MSFNADTTAVAVRKIDEYLCRELPERKLFKHTYICKQIEKRKKGGSFDISDHIRAMVYSMLSSGISWDRVEHYIDEESGRITLIDKAFNDYDIDYILNTSPEIFAKAIKKLHCASQATMKQMEALVNVNVRKLLDFEKQNGSIDCYYEKFITEGCNMTCLVRQLSANDSKDKLSQMGVALVCEYLKNVGYDIAKPDRHIRRILGSKALSCSEKETANIYESIDIVAKIAAAMDKPAAEVDYILWAYCASGFGEICTVQNAKCFECIVNDVCKKEQ